VALAFTAPAKESKASPPEGDPDEWQLMQCARKIGSTWSYVTTDF
jgi:hypothetical protein